MADTRQDTTMAEERSDSLRERIAKECPILYEGASSAYWECGRGWDVPLECLSRQLEELNRDIGVKHGLRIVVAQVKEKYATLRFYWSLLVEGKAASGRDEVIRRMETKAAELVREAENACRHVCEACGTPIGTPDSPQCWTLGWHRYLCRACASAPLADGWCERYEMNGRFYMGDSEIPNPFKRKDKERKKGSQG